MKQSAFLFLVSLLIWDYFPNKVQAVYGNDSQLIQSKSLHVQGQFNVVKDLPDKGVDPNIRDINGNTVLHLAVKSGRIDPIKRLLSKGADPNIKDSEGNTPLHVVIENGSIDIIRILIKKGADINLVNSKNETPLLIAFKAGRDDIGKLLLGKEVDNDLTFQYGITPSICYKRALKKRDATAQFNLGVMFDRGIMVDKNDSSAKQWYKKSALQGFGEAQYNIGLMYSNEDQYGNRNVYLASKWLYRAALYFKRIENNKMVSEISKVIKRMDPENSYNYKMRLLGFDESLRNKSH